MELSKVRTSLLMFARGIISYEDLISNIGSDLALKYGRKSQNMYDLNGKQGVLEMEIVVEPSFYVPENN